MPVFTEEEILAIHGIIQNEQKILIDGLSDQLDKINDLYFQISQLQRELEKVYERIDKSS